jgi:hypothetical protein
MPEEVAEVIGRRTRLLGVDALISKRATAMCEEDATPMRTADGYSCDYSNSLKMRPLRLAAERTGAPIDWCGSEDNPCGRDGICSSTTCGYECRYAPPPPPPEPEPCAVAPPEPCPAPEPCAAPKPMPCPVAVAKSPCALAVAKLPCEAPCARNLWGMVGWASSAGCPRVLIYVMVFLAFILFVVLACIAAAVVIRRTNWRSSRRR